MLSYKRDHYCGLLNESMAGQTVHLSGWVQRTRDLGGLVFVWLRDREGLVQLVFDSADCAPETFELARSLRAEYVVTVVGEVRLRDASAVNRELATGAIEVVAREAELLNKSDTPPIYIDDKADESELVRLKYRYLDLRRPSMQRKLRLRAKLVSCIRTELERRASPRSRRRSCPSPRPRARATSSCPAACIPARSTRCRRARRSTSSF